MNECETQMDRLREEMDTDIWTFRWLWLINLAAIVWGVISRHHDVIVIAAVSAIVSIIGIGRTRRGRKLVDRVDNVCFPSHKESHKNSRS